MKDQTKDRNETSPRARQRRATLRLTTDAMMIALYFVLTVYLAIDTPLVKFSISTLPILLCAFLFGMPDTLAVATLGSFLYQMVQWGPSAYTALWVAPFTLMALYLGGATYLFRTHQRPQVWKIVVIIITAELLLTLLNSVALLIAGQVTSPWALLLSLPKRLLNGAARTACTVSLSLALLPPLRKVLNRR